MSLMQAQKQRDLKYQASTLLNSSRDLGWSTMFAELRSHGPYEQPGTAGPHLEIALAVRGSDEGLVATKFAGTWRRVRPTTGTIWLRPIATKADECRMAPSAWEAIHLYMSSVVFAHLKDDYNLPAGPEHGEQFPSLAGMVALGEGRPRGQGDRRRDQARSSCGRATTRWARDA